MVSGNKNAAEWVLDYIGFFNGRGYALSSGFASLFFDAVCAAGMQDADVRDMEPVLRTLTVKCPSQDRGFSFDFDDFLHGRQGRSSLKDAEKAARDYRRMQDELKETEYALAALKEDIGTARARLEKAEEQLKGNGELSGAAASSLLKDRAKAGGSFDALAGTVGNPDVREALIGLRTLPTVDGDALYVAIMDLMHRCVGMPDGPKLMKHLEKVWNAYKKNSRDLNEGKTERLKQDLAEKEARRAVAQAKLDRLIGSMPTPDIVKAVQKLRPAYHREEFLPGASAQSWAEGLPAYFDKDFTALTPKEREQVESYIRANAREFRTRMARAIRSGQRRRPDIAETCRKACATDGIPMRLCYKKPARSRASLVLVLDISGSCREASELMLFFAYCMRDVFPRGCRAYAFVNRLYDISGLMDAGDPGTAIRKVLDTVPTRGVYSDYSRPLAEFHSQHFSEVSRDTVLIFIGDARNNSNPSGEEHLKAVCRKSRRAFWINTEPRAEWDTGDSIIGIYKPYLRWVMEARTAGGLLKCMDRIRSLTVVG